MRERIDQTGRISRVIEERTDQTGRITRTVTQDDGWIITQVWQNGSWWNIKIERSGR